MSTKMSDNISRPKITYMPIIVEPAFPTFTLRPIKGNLNQQTANLIIVNTSPHKLIFKIVPKSSDVSYSIRPEIDYLAPNGCRLVGISINQAPQPKRKHDFTYKVLALNPNESFGISAVQFWEQNQLENNAPLQEAQFVCLEAEVESSLDSSKRSVPRVRRKRIDNEPKLSSSADDPIRMRRRVSSLDHSETSNYPQQKLSLHYKKQSMAKDSLPEIIQCSCHCCKYADSSQYFWQQTSTLRSFFYGFAFAFICSVLLAIRKK